MHPARRLSKPWWGLGVVRESSCHAMNSREIMRSPKNQGSRSVKHRLAIALTVLIAVFAMSGSAYGSIASPCPLRHFAGGYETGDFSQWWLHQWSMNPDPAQGYNIHNVGRSTAKIVTSPAAQGRFAAQFQVFPSTGTNPNDRAEIVASQAESGGYPGQSWWYGWWTYFPGPRRTGGTEAATGMTSRSSSARITSRRRCRSGSTRLTTARR